MNANWTMEELLGYLRSWSSTERFIAATNRNPLEQIASDLEKAWGDRQRKRRIMWPLVLRVGIKSRAEPTKE
jgi:hypothetical protein